MLTIDGERIRLRDHQVEDLEAMHAWLSDSEVTIYLSRHSTTLQETAEYLAECLEEAHRLDRTRYYMAAVLKQNGAMIGDAGFTLVGSHEADIGFFLQKPYWGQGYATEAAEIMIRYCFTTLGLHRVTAGCDEENHASESVIKKCGMRMVVDRKHAQLIRGEWRNRLEYAITRDEWLIYQEQAGKKGGSA